MCSQAFVDMRKRNNKCADCGSIKKGASQYYCRECTNLKYKESGHLKQWLSRVKYRYNISEEEAIELYDKNNCEICQIEFSNDISQKQRCVDHDHKTDEVRGVLCRNCNSALGLFKDSALIMNKAIKYLNR
jgi:hypothetical protein